MLQLPANVRIFVCTLPVDFRKGFDGLHGLVLESLGQDPLSGDWFVFLNRRRDRVKILAWEGDGLSLYYKRLEQGTFAQPKADDASLVLSAAELAMLLGGLDWQQTRKRKRYRRAS